VVLSDYGGGQLKPDVIQQYLVMTHAGTDRTVGDRIEANKFKQNVRDAIATAKTYLGGLHTLDENIAGTMQDFAGLGVKFVKHPNNALTFE